MDTTGLDTAGIDTTSTDTRHDLPLSRYVFLIGAAVFVVLEAVSGRYGFFPDELYMLQCGRHLQASYVDQPVLAPLLMRVSFAVFGVWLPGLRLWAALATAVTVVVGGLTAREFGAGRRAQVLAAVAVATMPQLLEDGHIANTTPLMICGEASLGLVVARIGRTGDTRWWLAGGAVAGIGAEDNHLVGFLAIALVIAALALGVRPDRWLAGGAAIAVALMVPDIWWQAAHGWPTIPMTHALNESNGGLAGAVTWLTQQGDQAALVLVWVWVAGLWFLWRSGRPTWRAIPWAYGVLFVVYMLITGKHIYYLCGVYVTLFAAGAVAVDQWLFARPIRIRIVAAATAAWTVVLISLPVLPTVDDARYNPDTVESVGWPELVGTVHNAWLSIPASQRSHAVIFTLEYSEAAAINELGSGLPTAVSGQNTEWWWGPGNPDATTLLIVTPPPKTRPTDRLVSLLPHYCTGLRAAGTLSNPYGIRNSEYGGKVFVCTGLKQQWGTLWPLVKSYS